MAKYVAGDTILARDITDDLIGATIRWAEDEVCVEMELGRIERKFGSLIIHPMNSTVGIDIEIYNTITVVASPPVKIIQPDEPTAPGTLVRIEGEDGWEAMRRGIADVLTFEVYTPSYSDGWNSWKGILALAAGRQIIVSSAPEFSDPDTITEWPEDETEIRGHIWVDRDGDYQQFLDDEWKFSDRRTPGFWTRYYVSHPKEFLPFTRNRV